MMVPNILLSALVGAIVAWLVNWFYAPVEGEEADNMERRPGQGIG